MISRATIQPSLEHRATPRRSRGRAGAIVLAASLASFAAGAFVAASAGIAGGAVLVGIARAIKGNALIAPSLAQPGAGLNLDPIASNGVLPDSMPGAGPGPERDALAPATPIRAAISMPVLAASPDPLAGPRLPVAIHATLVRRDLDNTLVMPDPSPAEAALRLVSLDEGSRRAIEAALNIRGARLDHAVIINLPFIIVAQSGQAGGNRPVVAGAAGVALYRSREFFAIDDLESLIASQLPAPQRSHYRALLQEFWHEFALDAARARAAKGQDPAPESLLIAEARLKLFGDEAARSFDRTLRSGDMLHYWFARHLGLSPAQAGPFRAKIAAYSQAHASDGSKADKLQLLADLRDGLTATQRRTLERNMKGFLD